MREGERPEERGVHEGGGPAGAIGPAGADGSTGADGRRGGPCLSDGTLLRYLDGAPTGEELDRARRHLEGCARCRARLERLEVRDRSVRSWIRAHDPEPPSRSAYRFGGAVDGEGGGAGSGNGDPSAPERERPGTDGPSYLRWLAAAVVIFAVGVALAGPASGWILEGIRSLVGRSDPDPAARVEDVGDRESGGATAFVPVGAELVVRFSSLETRGTLTIAVVTDSVVAITPPSSAVELAVEGNRLSVGNAAVPVGGYRLSVPASVRTVRVRVPGAEEAVVDLAAGGGESPPAVGRTLRLPPGGR